MSHKGRLTCLVFGCSVGTLKTEELGGERFWVRKGDETTNMGIYGS